jgi:hypothetical protein
MGKSRGNKVMPEKCTGNTVVAVSFQRKIRNEAGIPKSQVL